jgi:hypothetical protein
MFPDERRVFPDEESVSPVEEHRFLGEDLDMLREVIIFASWSKTLYIGGEKTIHRETLKHDILCQSTSNGRLPT